MLAFDQTAGHADHFSLTDKFYYCFACVKSHSLLIVTTLLVINSILTFVQTACLTDQFSLIDQGYDCFAYDEYCVNFQNVCYLATTNYDDSSL